MIKVGGNNFFKKFAYLYKTSVEIIQEYGFLYFLRFGTSQVKQQKLDILKPKDDYEKLLIKKSLDKKTQYRIWKEQQEKQSTSTQSSTHDNFLSVALIIRENSETLVKCIESVFEQSFTKFELIIVTDNQNAFETIKKVTDTKSVSDVIINLNY